MSVHEVAAHGFGADPETYERARPGYPPDAVAWLAEHLRVAPGRRVVDLAAGTGKLTRALVPRGADLLAVEPVAGMRAVLARLGSGTPIAAGTAEALPLATGSCDAAVVAQAFHWFDADAALAELHRVLRRGGRLGLVWNARDRSRAWVDRVWSIMDRVERRAPWRDHEHWRDSIGDRAPGFGPWRVAEFHHEQLLGPDLVVARIASVSHVAVLPHERRRAVLDEVREVLATDPETRGRESVAIPYRVDAMWCARVDRTA